MGVSFSGGFKGFAPNRFKAGTLFLAPVWQTAEGSLGTFLEGDSPTLELDVSNATSVQLLSGELPGGYRFETAPLSIIGQNGYIKSGSSQDTAYTFTIRASNKDGISDRTFTVTLEPNGDKWFTSWDDTSAQQYIVDLGNGASAITETDQIPSNKWYISWDDTSTQQYTVDLGNTDSAVTEVDQVETNKWFTTWDDTSSQQYTVDIGNGNTAQTEVDQVETNKWFTTWDDTSLQQYTVDLGSADSAVTEVDQVETNKWFTTWDDDPTQQYTVDQTGSGTADL